jgi:phosphatidylserine/phosphatidylglycerophosphate/cardiolipin synthase-like enzyme
MPSERTEPRFWGTYKGRIIKAIAIDGARTWGDLQELTGFNRQMVNKVLAELFENKAINKFENGEYRVAKDLYYEYRDYFSTSEASTTPTLKVKQDDQNNIVRELQDWLSLKKIDLKDNHVFLEGGKLDGLTSHLIENVRTELLVINPFVDMANIVNMMKERVQKGCNVTLLTRVPGTKDKSEVLDNLKEYGMKVLTNKTVHAKIMIFDRGVAIISSMNLYPFSVAGGSWEAGIATCSDDTVSDVLNTVFMKLEEKETSLWEKSQGISQ